VTRNFLTGQAQNACIDPKWDENTGCTPELSPFGLLTAGADGACATHRKWLPAGWGPGSDFSRLICGVCARGCRKAPNNVNCSGKQSLANLAIRNPHSFLSDLACYCA